MRIVVQQKIQNILDYFMMKIKSEGIKHVKISFSVLTYRRNSLTQFMKVIISLLETYHTQDLANITLQFM